MERFRLLSLLRIFPLVPSPNIVRAPHSTRAHNKQNATRLDPNRYNSVIHSEPKRFKILFSLTNLTDLKHL